MEFLKKHGKPTNHIFAPDSLNSFALSTFDLRIISEPDKKKKIHLDSHRSPIKFWVFFQ